MRLMVQGTRNRLENELDIPVSKYHAHRALVLASLAEGTSVVRGLSATRQIEWTVSVLRALGTRIDIDGDSYIVHGGRYRASDVLERGSSGPDGVLNVGSSPKNAALASLPLGEADHLAVMGDNGKLLIFPVRELPEMPRGKGVKLQTYREGGLRDAAAFKADDGMATVDASGRTRIWPEWREWLGRRAAAGKLAPKGFPANKRFRPK